MKADDGHFEYRRIVYFVVQITTNFMCHITKYDASFVLANIPSTSEMTTWSRKKFNNFVAIKNNTMLLSIFMWLWMSNKCVKFHVKTPSGCWENGKKNFRGYFFYRTLYTVSQKTVQILFSSELSKFPPILVIFDRYMAKCPKFYVLYSFPTSPDPCCHTTL